MNLRVPLVPPARPFLSLATPPDFKAAQDAETEEDSTTFTSGPPSGFLLLFS